MKISLPTPSDSSYRKILSRNKLEIDSFVEWSPENKSANGDAIKEAELKKQAVNKFYGALLLWNNNWDKYGMLLKTLVSQYSMDQDQYPWSLVEATLVLELHKLDPGYYEKKKASKKKSWTKNSKEQSQKMILDQTKIETSLAQENSHFLLLLWGSTTQGSTVPRERFKNKRWLMG